MPGCSNRLGPVIATQAGGIDRPNFPDIFVEKAKECVAEYGGQLEPQHYRFDSKIDVDEDGYKQNVMIDGIPTTAPDLGACMRNALREMPIAEEPFHQGVKSLKYQRAEALAEQRRLMSHPVVIVVAGVTIIVSEVALEAGAVTILFAVTVKVVEKVAEDIAEGGKAHCAAHYATCMGTSSSKKNGNHWRQSRCGMCARVCVRNEGIWPTEIGNGSCEYWK